MYRVALNTAIDIVRKTDNQPAFARLSPRELNMPIIQDQVYSIKVEKLYNAIKNLSNSEKAIILLYLEDYNYREISEVIGISESNAGVKINRIKKKLIKMLDDDGKK